MKILFLRIGGIGDILLTTPALRCVKEKYPEAEIHFLAGEKEYPILENNPFIDRLIIYKDSHIEAPKTIVILKLLPWFRETFRGITYDYIIDFESSWYTAFMTLFIPAKTRIGFTIDKLRRFYFNLIYSRRINYKKESVYLVEKYITLVRSLGIPGCSGKNLVLELTKEEKDFADIFYKENSVPQNALKILFSESGDWPTKKWPVAHWAALAQLINNSYKNCKMIFLGGPGNDGSAAKLKSMNIPNMIFSPKTTLRNFSAIVGRGDILVSCDSGVRHIGVALGIKTIGLFGPVNEKNWSLPDEKTKIITAPGVACRVCHKSNCRNKQHDIRCMTLILPENVFSVIRQLTL